MPIFDVTSAVVRTDLIEDRIGRRHRNIKAIVDWLSENIGEYYGVGGDNTSREPTNFTKGTEVLYIGSGWQLERDWRGDPDGYIEVWWKVDITDEAKGVLFALKWAT